MPSAVSGSVVLSVFAFPSPVPSPSSWLPLDTPGPAVSGFVHMASQPLRPLLVGLRPPILSPGRIFSRSEGASGACHGSCPHVNSGPVRLGGCPSQLIGCLGAGAGLWVYALYLEAGDKSCALGDAACVVTAPHNWCYHQWPPTKDPPAPVLTHCQVRPTSPIPMWLLGLQ